MGNFIRGSGVGYPLDMAQGAPTAVYYLKTYSCGRQTLNTYKYVISSLQAEQWLFVYFTFFTHCDYRILSSHVKKILFHSKDFVGFLIFIIWSTKLHKFQQVSFLLQLVVGFVKIELDWLDWITTGLRFISTGGLSRCLQVSLVIDMRCSIRHYHRLAHNHFPETNTIDYGRNLVKPWWVFAVRSSHLLLQRADVARQVVITESTCGCHIGDGPRFKQCLPIHSLHQLITWNYRWTLRVLFFSRASAFEFSEGLQRNSIGDTTSS